MTNEIIRPLQKRTLKIEKIFEVQNPTFFEGDGVFFYSIKTSEGWFETKGLIDYQRVPVLNLIKEEYPHITVTVKGALLSQCSFHGSPHLKAVEIRKLDNYIMMLELEK